VCVCVCVCVCFYKRAVMMLKWMEKKCECVYIYINIKDSKRIPLQFIKPYWGSRSIAPFIFNSALDGGESPTSTPSSFNRFLTFWRQKKISCFFQESKGKHINLYQCHLESIHLWQIYCISTFGGLNIIGIIVVRNIFYKISKCFRSSQVLS
jgi:hypothetical protein